MDDTIPRDFGRLAFCAAARSILLVPLRLGGRRKLAAASGRRGARHCFQIARLVFNGELRVHLVRVPFSLPIGVAALRRRRPGNCFRAPRESITDASSAMFFLCFLFMKRHFGSSVLFQVLHLLPLYFYANTLSAKTILKPLGGLISVLATRAFFELFHLFKIDLILVNLEHNHN